jgi:predicted Zn-dependent protease
LPSTDPLLAYYRGFCREKLGQSGAADYAAASRMPLLYVFPNNPDEITVLHAALAVNGSDASAHFLLGTLFFSKGIVDSALEEWKLAESLNPKIASLQASVGRVLLDVKMQPVEAAAEFQRGFQMEPNNAALYIGLNRAMQKMGKTPAQRAEMMKRFPDPARMPEPLVRALVGALREGGRNDEANAVLAHRFLARKEGEAPLQPQK